MQVHSTLCASRQTVQRSRLLWASPLDLGRTNILSTCMSGESSIELNVRAQRNVNRLIYSHITPMSTSEWTNDNANVSWRELDQWYLRILVCGGLFSARYIKGIRRRGHKRQTG